MADIVIKQIEEGMTGRQVADLLYQNFLALVGAIGTGGGGDIPTADIEKGVTAYGWGDHRQAGYLKGITGGMVTGALGYTPMDEAAWTNANIKALLGIADWALAASKPAYTTKEVAEDGNLYFTDARAVAALAGVTNALAGDIGANATAIGVLQGYFTNGVAKSAAKLATSRKLWGQLFNGEADVTGALTGVTDITASGVLTIGKIKIGDGVIEWDATNGGFKVTGGLWATDYLSSKGVNTGASGGGGGGSSYQRLDTWDGYTTAKDGWVLSAKLGYGMKTTQDDILRQLADISGQGTNVTFTPALTSGTQIGTLTIDGEPVKMYAPSIPNDDINKGVTAYGWGNHASVGYLLKSGGTMTGNLTMGSSDNNEWLPVEFNRGGYKGFIGVGANQLEIGSLDGYIRISPTNLTYLTNNSVKTIWHSGNFTPSNYLPLSGNTTATAISGDVYFGYQKSVAFLASNGSLQGAYGMNDSFNPIWWNGSGTHIILHSGNYTDYTYSKSQVDSSLGGYLPLSGGTITGDLSLNQYLRIKAWVGYGSGSCDMWYDGNTGILHLTASNIANYHGEIYIHSGNIGSQSVAYASNAGMIEGHRLSENGAGVSWGRIAFVGADGVMDIGKYIDFRNDTTSHDFSTRLLCTGNYANYVSLPSTSGTLALLTDNVASATKLQTARSLWGQSFNGENNVSGGLNGANFILSNMTNGYFVGNRTDGAGATDGGLMLYTYGYTPISFYTNGAEYMRISQDGYVGIGTTSPQYKLDVNGALAASGAATFGGHVSIVSNDWCEFSVTRGNLGVSSVGGLDGGGVYFAHTQNSVTTYMYLKSGVGLSVYGTLYSSVGIWSDGYVSAKGQNTSSDMRLKRVLEEVTLSVDEIAAAPAVRFAWKGGAGVDVGTSAQYWEKVLPDVVKRDDAGWLTMQYGNAAMVAVIALARRVKELEEQLKIKS